MYPVEHIWGIHMLKILQAHLLQAFVANSKIGAICVLYTESFRDKNLAVRKVFAFSDSGNDMDDNTMNPIIIINISGTYTLTATNKWGEDTVACEVSIS